MSSLQYTIDRCAPNDLWYVVRTVRHTYGTSYVRYVIRTVCSTSDVSLLCSRLGRGVFWGDIIHKNQGTHDVGGCHRGLLGDLINKGLGILG